MGAETLIHARAVDGDDIRVVVPRDRRVAVGETLHLVPIRPDPCLRRRGRAVRS